LQLRLALRLGVACRCLPLYLKENVMTRISLIGAALLLIASSATPPASAAPAGMIKAGGLSQVELVQEKKKSETVTQKVKRVWRNITTPNHSFCVACPVLIPMSQQTCTTEAKTVDEARAKCASQHPLCSIRDKAC
jgi:hypothetical protein